MTNIFTGIEITKKYINYFMADSSYRIKGVHKTALPFHIPADKFIDEVENGFREAIRKTEIPAERIASISISVPAAIDHKNGSIIYSAELPQLQGLPLKDELGARLKKLIILDTEANVRTFIEHKLGSAVRYSNFIFIVLDSWISAGVYINNSLLRSKRGIAHELGHTIVEPHGRKCGCSQRGCLEEYVSFDAVVRYYLKHRRGSARNTMTVYDLFRLAGTSDFAAINAFEKMGNYLGLALINMVNIVKPDAVIFAGDFSRALNFFLPSIKSTLDTRSYYGSSGNITYRKSDLGTNALREGLVHLAKDSYTNAYNLKVCDDLFII